MKKKALTGILVASMLGMMLTGCGDNKEVTKTDETQVEITTEKESEATETVVEETTEVATEAPVEEVASDFLTENGLTVTPNGSMTATVAQYDSDDLIDLFYSENDFSQSSSVNDTSSFTKSPPTTNLVIVERPGTHSVNISPSPNALERMGRLLPRRSARG